jgi:hypothetical protein
MDDAGSAHNMGLAARRQSGRAMERTLADPGVDPEVAAAFAALCRK